MEGEELGLGWPVSIAYFTAQRFDKVYKINTNGTANCFLFYEEIGF